ncbi:hypothetical protein diail_7256 [Diaporthe ilicicola]|nr:hypothetical protein diail_7256 [Diaporthe ilicicola]
MPIAINTVVKLLFYEGLDLDKGLTLRTYVRGYSLSPADKEIWRAVRANKVAVATVRRGSVPHVLRWLTYLESVHPEIQTHFKASQERARNERAAASRIGGSYNVGPKGTETENGVVTRFPPEPSGYLHVGHAKAAFLNDYFAHDAFDAFDAFDAKPIVRFDDTNPAKEKQEFDDTILHDLGQLGIEPDQVIYTNDRFSQLYEIAREMIRDGKAYADNDDPKALTLEKSQGLPSKRRDRPCEESLAIFEEMRAGTPLGMKHCIRAQIKFDSLNGAPRDPVI